MVEFGLGSWPVIRVDDGGVTIEESCSRCRESVLSDSVDVELDRSPGVEV